MIYLFLGDDVKNKLFNYEKFIKSIPVSTEIFYINRNSFDPTQTESFYSGASLFSVLSAVVFQNIFEYEETRDFILNKLELMEKSANSFIFLESKLNKSILDAFKKSLPDDRQTAPFVNIFELPKEKKEKFDNFLVANAFEQKNKLNLWIYFREAVDKGVGMEMKKNFCKFSEFKLKNYTSRLSYLLPQARKESQDAEAVFEKFLLEAF
ncbi:MAG: hypothetical protein US65_C0013G0002 [Candidatus Yanofskybacteria bacterium GW2011_GWC2_37_9]|uniref:DNA polymerase III delta N-terminal domain-containing protein n=1 Tax=Candidatus Yanofskybacteria bacterium GW2011_GWC2_37_9 TaxID=1619028 RepID=A0A0G0HVU5_9BACT|nr:MAG: hypothetical protein US65_C0013G0002 [Candidatus Yanofskybacteria bacterium GW2011_GWC2_37_9]